MNALFRNAAMMITSAIVGGAFSYYIWGGASDEKKSAPAAKNNYTSEVIDNQGDSIVTVRLHTWPGLRVLAQVSPLSLGHIAIGAECQGDFEDEHGQKISRPKIGDQLVIRNLTSKYQFDDAAEYQRPQKDVIAGPLPAKILKFGDGDTFDVEVQAYDGSTIMTAVRVLGIDTPEKGKRAKCKNEAELAKQASALTKEMLASRDIELRNISIDKYGGRVDADVYDMKGQKLADVLITKGLAQPYDGGTKPSWCGVKYKNTSQ